MNILSSSSPHLSSEHQHIFSQGADCIISTDHHSAALWYTHVPSDSSHKIGTLGACSLSKKHQPDKFLLKCAEYLAEEQQCQKVIGPMNGNTWLKHRLIIESDNRHPFLMEPIEPLFYKEAFESAGFSILSTYCSHLVDLNLPQKNHQNLLSRFHKKGIKLRCIDEGNFKRDLISIFQLSLRSFSNNYLYTPISQDTFIAKYMESKDLIDPELVLMAESDGELIAYLFCIPDLEAVKQRGNPAVILKTLASKADKAYSGVGSLLVYEAHRIAIKKGYEEAIHALQHEENSSTRISQRFDAKKFRRYALMAKTYNK